MQSSFIENKEQIEKDWDRKFGYRKNEIVFIGQSMDEKLIKSLLDNCLSKEIELDSRNWLDSYKDEWPIERVYPI